MCPPAPTHPLPQHLGIELGTRAGPSSVFKMDLPSEVIREGLGTLPILQPSRCKQENRGPPRVLTRGFSLVPHHLPCGSSVTLFRLEDEEGRKTPGGSSGPPPPPPTQLPPPPLSLLSACCAKGRAGSSSSLSLSSGGRVTGETITQVGRGHSKL